MSIRTWFARKKLRLKSEQIEVLVPTGAAFTRNGQQVAVINDIPTFINEVATLEFNAGVLNDAADTDLLWTGLVTPPVPDITTVAGSNQCQITQRGVYLFKLQLQFGVEADFRVKIKVNGVETDVADTKVPLFGGLGNSDIILMHAQGVDAPMIISFSLRARDIAVPINPVAFGGPGTGEVIVWRTDSRVI